MKIGLNNLKDTSSLEPSLIMNLPLTNMLFPLKIFLSALPEGSRRPGPDSRCHTGPASCAVFQIPTPLPRLSVVSRVLTTGQGLQAQGLSGTHSLHSERGAAGLTLPQLGEQRA